MALMIAANNGHLEVVCYLLEQGADRDKACIMGYTTLHDAVRKGHLESSCSWSTGRT